MMETNGERILPAMTFSGKQRTRTYEILGFFQGNTFDWTDYRTWPGGIPSSTPYSTQINFTTATDRLNTIFTEIEAVNATLDDREAQIKEILTEYEDVRFDTASVKSGGGAGQPGARYSPYRQRRRLKEMIEAHLGFQVRTLIPSSSNIGGSMTPSGGISR